MAAEKIANRYATALLDLCEGNLDLAKTYRDAFKAIAEIFENEDIRSVLTNPVVNSQIKSDVLKEVAVQIKADKLLSMFLEAVADANRVGIIPAIYTSLHKLILKAEGTVEADISTVFPLDDENLNTVKGSLESMTSQKVIISNSIDKSILGGFVVRVGNSVLDMSLKTKLDAMTQSAVR